jgi:hypothetical protein
LINLLFHLLDLINTGSGFAKMSRYRKELFPGREPTDGPGRTGEVRSVKGMFCPQCGSTQSDELRFCKSCGANLFAVRKAVTSPESVERFDWNKTWLAEMMRSGEENVKRAAEIERIQGITPETSVGKR